VITGSKKEAQVALSHLKQMARTTYSNPPMHPASVIKGILSDAALFARWQEEICAMRKRMQSVRASFVEKMEAKDPEGGWSALLQGSGLFAMTGLGKEAILRLREENGVYIGGEGRINLTGLHPKNLDLVTDAIAGCR
jgi:aspartate/tyrosine/aromatic aminotransferase